MAAGETIEGVVHVFNAGGSGLQVVFTSDFGTGKHLVSTKAEAEHFIAEALHRQLIPGDLDRLLAGEPADVRATITVQEYNQYF